jgi:medium-chain acyl-[acyl-carrier-protein] hydrolase
MTYGGSCLEILKPNPRALLRLFCFPYAGGSSVIFRGWESGLPDFVELIGIQPPGRAQRLKEAPFTRIQPLVESLITSIRHVAGHGRFDFFGHSMGAVVAFEVARRLKQRFDLSPTILFVSGRQAPHLPEKKAPTHNLPDQQFIHELRRLAGTPPEVLDTPELMDLLLSALRADFEAIETYRSSESDPLDCPICAFGGLEDEDVSEEDLDAWRVHTKARFQKILLPGDHFFLNAERELLLKYISENQRSAMETASLALI